MLLGRLGAQQPSIQPGPVRPRVCHLASQLAASLAWPARLCLRALHGVRLPVARASSILPAAPASLVPGPWLSPPSLCRAARLQQCRGILQRTPAISLAKSSLSAPFSIPAATAATAGDPQPESDLRSPLSVTIVCSSFVWAPLFSPSSAESARPLSFFSSSCAHRSKRVDVKKGLLLVAETGGVALLTLSPRLAVTSPRLNA